MFQQERMDSILTFLSENKRISIEQICKLYDVSRDTARRDLVLLEKNGCIVRTHGGAILPSSEHYDIKPYRERLNIESEEKYKIAKKSLSFIKPGEAIFMDTSTTVQNLAELISSDNLTVVTNSINLGDILSKNSNMNITILGGTLNTYHRYLYGPSTLSMLSNYHFNKAFIGGISLSSKGLTGVYEDAAAILREVIKNSDEVILLIDHSKLNKTSFIKICDLKDIDIMITDKMPSEDFMKILDENNVNLIVTD